MSRTIHSRSYHPLDLHCMKVQNRRKGENAALQEINEEMVQVRHINRLKSYMTQIPDPRNDKHCSSSYEYLNKINIFHIAEDVPHWTKNELYTS